MNGFTRRFRPASLTLLSTLLLAWQPGCTQPWERSPGPRDRSDLPVRVLRVRGPVYAIEDFNYWRNNTAAFIHADGIFFFDAGWNHKTARSVIWKAAASSQADFHSVTLTGYPVDRSGGLWGFRSERIPIVMSARSFALLRRYWQPMQAEMRGSFSSWIETPQHETPAQLYEGEYRPFGDRIRVIEMPDSITPDAAVVLFVEERTLYAGALCGLPVLWPRLVNVAGARLALDRIAALGWDRLICARGPAMQDRSALNEMRSALDEIESRRAGPVSQE